MSDDSEGKPPPIQVGDALGSTAIAAQISLPAAVWERLTADLRSDDREALGRPDLPDTPLPVRIETFLNMQAIAWAASVIEYQEQGGAACDLDGDLDDGVPF